MFFKRLYHYLLKIKKILATETQEVQSMLGIYRRFLKGESTKVEMISANVQFRELLKSAGLGAFALLPFALITIPFVVYLGKKFDVDVLPKWFNQNKGKK